MSDIKYNRIDEDLQQKIISNRESHWINPYAFKDEMAVRRNNDIDKANLWRPVFVRDVEKIMHLPYYNRYDKVTITEVHLKSNAKQSRHSHEFSEQIWYALKGNGRLLLANDNEQKFTEGDVVRFEAGDIHGLYNDSDEEFVYISVTTPPIDFSYAYKEIGKK